MLPTTGSPKGQFIHINPDFKNGVLQKLTNSGTSIVSLPLPTTTHINPLFMNPPQQTTKIHMNPEFLNRSIMQQGTGLKAFTEFIPQMENQTKLPTQSATKSTQPNKIISQSRTRLVRESHSQMKIQLKSAPSSRKPLLLLTKRKLIRAPNLPAITSTLNNEFQKDKQKQKAHPLTGIIPMLKRRPCAFVARYALRRSNSVKKSIFPRSIVGQKSIAQIDKSMTSVNKQMRLININGILYKSSGNKLQRKIDSNDAIKANPTKTKPIQNLTKSSKSTKPISEPTQNPVGRTLYVRGTKYVMDPMGFKLTRATESNTCGQAPISTLLPKLNTNTASTPHRNRVRRIDIGGITYLASGQSNNVFLRTSTHLVLAHLNHAKQRSVNTLSRCLAKTNKPCLIYQRLGKCAALERGKCSKVHDKQRITVCPKFLQGLCFNANCLLSHNKTLQKMPVCRFYLQGSCVRTDCPYLHKKLNDDSEICEDFRRGFCVLAEQCNKQHIFSKAKPKANMPQIPSSEPPSMSTNDAKTATNDATVYRYFSGKGFVLGETGMEAAVESSIVEEGNHSPYDDYSKDLSSSDTDDSNLTTNRKRKQLGTLPSFIPLS